jgi:hypothetical protein
MERKLSISPNNILRKEFQKTTLLQEGSNG